MWSHAHDKDIPENWCFWQRSFWSFSKKKGRFFIMPCLALVILSLSCHALLWSCFHALLHFAMLLLTKSTPKTKTFSSTIDSQRFEDKKRNLLFTCHYSLSLFICYCSWHCSLRIFAYLRGVFPYVWNKFYFRSSFLERVFPCEPFLERFPCFPTSLQSL